MHGNMQYSFATHTVAGTGNTIEYGTKGAGTFDKDSHFSGGSVELRITGLILRNGLPANAAQEAAIEASGSIHNFAFAHMYGAPTLSNQAAYAVYADALDDYAQIYLGAAGTDIYSGSGFADVIQGNGGDDQLTGGAGNDVISGGAGADRISGGSGRDTASYADASQSVTVELARPGRNAGDADGDRLLSIEKLVGSAYGDTLTGSDGNDILLGGSGADTLSGGKGIDRLDGGADADRFVFRTGDTGPDASRADVIAGFETIDRIDLSGIDADHDTAGNQAFTFIGKAAFSGVAGELRFQRAGPVTWIEADTDGNAGADLVIQIDGAAALRGAYFDL
jgi:Ca2+-binding RTX toxin-like protein